MIDQQLADVTRLLSSADAPESPGGAETARQLRDADSPVRFALEVIRGDLDVLLLHPHNNVRKRFPPRAGLTTAELVGHSLRREASLARAEETGGQEMTAEDLACVMAAIRMPLEALCATPERLRYVRSQLPRIREFGEGPVRVLTPADFDAVQLQWLETHIQLSRVLVSLL